MIMLYADDTVLMSETEDELQYQLHCFQMYCENWKLQVNVVKTKIIIFGKGRQTSNVSFLYNGNEIEILMKEFKYLGVIFSRTCSFYSTRKCVVTRATRAMYAIIKKSRELNLSIDCQLDMFDKMVVPILLYGSELWGFENLCIIEKIAS